MSPWPEVERVRNRILQQHRTGRVFSYHQCVEETCGRWFPSERLIVEPCPTHCQLHDVSAVAARTRTGARLKKVKEKR